jgi:hypothetical protein
MYAMRLLLFIFLPFFVELHCTIHFGGGKEKWTVDVVVPCVCYVFFLLLLACLLASWELSVLFFGDRGRGRRREWKWFGRVIKGCKSHIPTYLSTTHLLYRFGESSLVKFAAFFGGGGRKKSRAWRSQVHKGILLYLLPT